MELRDKIKDAPKYPGCYIYKDGVGQVIYVGMSKYLPRRVASYFNRKHDDLKTQLLVENVRDVEYQIASSEAEALMMEEELIKLYMPKYNIKGKDDKSRVWSLRLTDEPFPKLSLERESGQEPNCINFTSGQVAHEVMHMISDIFPLRTCSYSLTPENVSAGKFKACLEHQLGRCTAPCVGLGGTAEYLGMVSMVRRAFELDLDPAAKWARRLMGQMSKQMMFEKANDYLIKLRTVDSLKSKLEPIRVRRYNKLAWSIKKSLSLANVPLVIEAFDNSHHQGDSNVAASVRFVNAMPDKSNYRRFIIKDGDNHGDDCRSFDEVIERRLGRLVRERAQLPHLIVVDGGVPQLNAAKAVLDRLGLVGRVDLISISKDRSHRSKTIHLADGTERPVEWPLFALIQEEIHRFAVKFHRERSAKEMLRGTGRRPSP